LGDSSRPHARIKSTPEDFVVEEVPLYEPSGEGSHVYVRFTKRDLTTEQAVSRIARALGAEPREAGIAGMKDKVAVTTQTVSFLSPTGTSPDVVEERARALGDSLEGIQVHEARRHTNKLKPGHLAENRFTIVVRGLPPGSREGVVAALEEVGKRGLPNAFGAQRFGREGDNAERARAWIMGEGPAPRDPRLRRLHWSSLQSAVFNAVLGARIQEGTWHLPIEGDLVKRRPSGGLFICTDVQADRARAEQGEVTPTGPMVGVKMRSPEGAALALERAICEQILGKTFDLERTKKLGEGTRRALRLWVGDLRVEAVTPRPEEEQAEGLRVYFVLPKGAYATTVLEAAIRLEQPSATDRRREGERETELAPPERSEGPGPNETDETS